MRSDEPHLINGVMGAGLGRRLIGMKSAVQLMKADGGRCDLRAQEEAAMPL